MIVVARTRAELEAELRRIAGDDRELSDAIRAALETGEDSAAWLAVEERMTFRREPQPVDAELVEFESSDETETLDMDADD